MAASPNIAQALEENPQVSAQILQTNRWKQLNQAQIMSAVP